MADAEHDRSGGWGILQRLTGVDPIPDPIERRLADLLWILLWVLLAGTGFYILLYGLIDLTNYGLWPDLVMGLCTVIALYSLRRGRLRLSTWLIILAILAILGRQLVPYGLLELDEAFIIFAIPVLLAGLFLDRRSLWITVALSVAILSLVAILEQAGSLTAPADAPDSGAGIRASLSLFILVILLFGYLLDRFAVFFRGTLTAAIAREHDLQEEIAVRRQAEQELKSAEEHYRSLFRTAQRQKQELELLDQVRTVLAGELDLQTLFRTVVEATARIFKYTHIGLYILEEDTLVIQHELGYRTKLEIPRLPLTMGIMGRVARTGRPVLLEDVTVDPDFLPASEEITSEVCVPLFDRGLVAGVLNIESTAGAMLTDADLFLMLAVSQYVGIAIERARLYSQVSQNELSLRKLFETALDAIVTIDERGIITGWNTQAERTFGWPASEAVGRRLSDTIIPPQDHSAHETGLKNFLSTGIGPVLNKRIEMTALHRDGRLFLVELAVVPIQSSGRYHFTAFVRDITDRKQSEREIQRRAEEFTALYDTARLLAGSQNLGTRLQVIVNRAALLFGTPSAGIFLFDPDQQSLVLAYTIGPHQPIGTRLRLGEGIAGRVAITRQPLIVDDYQTWPQRVETFAVFAFSAILHAPMVHHGELIGVLGVSDIGPTQRRFSEADAHLLSLFADQAASAVYESRQLADLERLNEELTRAYDSTLLGWAKALELRDKDTEGHHQRVTDMTLRLAGLMKLSGTEQIHIRRGALLHDIGKLGIPDSILLKPGQLTEEEWALMKKHPEYAYEFLAAIPFLRPALDIPFAHHERWDGSGYPRGLKGEEIPLAARLFMVVDVWDALRHDRPYRPAWADQQIHEHIRSLAGTHFDPHVVEIFLQLVVSQPFI